MVAALGGGAAGCGGPDPLLLQRPYDLKVPAGLGADPAPLLVMLHGYKVNAALEDLYLGLGRLVDAKGFLYALPDGTLDGKGFRFWNATDACCDIGHTGVDDVAYLRAVINDVKRRYRVDPRRVYLIGHSNGGFMSYRLACDLPGEFAALVSMAGATWKDPLRCGGGAAAAVPVSAVQLHGDADDVILYGGGRFDPQLGEYPGARDTVARWARQANCGGGLADTGARLDLLGGVAGAETQVERVAGCPVGTDVELWTMEGGGHIPLPLQATFAATLYDFLAAHPRPVAP